MDRHSCAILDDIVMISMDNTTIVGDYFQLHGYSLCRWTDILQEDNDLGRTNYWWIDILPVEDGPG
jgi:hypothetical protein